MTRAPDFFILHSHFELRTSNFELRTSNFDIKKASSETTIPPPPSPAPEPEPEFPLRSRPAARAAVHLRAPHAGAAHHRRNRRLTGRAAQAALCPPRPT